MSETKHEVHAKFVLDDHAAHTLEHIKEGFEKVGEKAHEVGGEIGGVFKTALGTALGFEAMGLIESFKSMGEEIFKASAGMAEQEKSIRGVLMITDKEGTSLEEMSEHAHELNEEFAQMSVETGASKSSLISAFDEMAERTGLSTRNVKHLTEEMASAGRAIPGGIDALSTGFSNMSAGMIRAKNPIVQLIAATGTLHGNAKSVAKQLQMMNPQRAMQLGIDAIQKMGAKMKDVPLTFQETIASMKQLREQIFESLGTPMLKAIGGPLGELRTYFMANREEINKWAEEVGKDAGKWLVSAAGDIKDGFHYLQAHSAEIKKDILDAMSVVRSTVQFLIDHREAIALAWGATKVPSIIGAVGGAAKGASAIGGAVMGFGGRMAGMTVGAGGTAVVATEGAAVAGAGGATAAGGAAAATAGASATALGAFVAAIGSVGMAAYQGVQLWDEAVTHNGVVLEAKARKEHAEQAAREGNVQEMDLMIKALYDAGQASDSYIAHLQQVGEAMREQKETAFRHESMIDPNARAEAKERSEIAESLAYKKAHKDDGDGKITASPVQNFFGGVHIQQDFKNVDPDRIALIFERKLATSARSKSMAATQAPHTAF